MSGSRRRREGGAGASGRGLPTWREWFLGLRSIPQFLRLAWETHRGYVAATVALRLLTQV